MLFKLETCLPLVNIRHSTYLKPPEGPPLPIVLDLMGLDSIFDMSSPLKANTEHALNSSPGPSRKEKTTEVLHILVSEGDYIAKAMSSDENLWW